MSAEAVRSDQSDEGTLRSAISRSYYAVYLTVRDRLFGNDGTRLSGTTYRKLREKFRQNRRKDPRSHDLVIFAISETSAPNMLRLTLSQQLDQLKDARVDADYRFEPANLRHVPETTWREYASKNVALASMLLPQARRLPPYGGTP